MKLQLKNSKFCTYPNCSCTMGTGCKNKNN